MSSNLKPEIPTTLTRLTSGNSHMTQNQLVDLLTAHISLYNTRFQNPNKSGGNTRSLILKWFTSLTIPQRQSHLAIVDHNFVQLLVRMLIEIQSKGHGRFIILPDIPSCGLPSFCYKKSHGLLSRVAESNHCERLVFESVRLFCSKEGERIDDCSCSVDCLDTLVVSDEFIENVDKFIDTMDGVSNGGFLGGEDREVWGSDWVEFDWLKDRGYYSMEAFVANRLEAALKLAWMNSTSGGSKKRGVKLKEKLAAAGVAANVFWRKKGCVDWWQSLDDDIRRKLLTVALGKAARSLTCEILEGAHGALEYELWVHRAGSEEPLKYIYAKASPKNTIKLPPDAEFCSAILPVSLPGNPSFPNLLNKLFVLQDIITLVRSGPHSGCVLLDVLYSTFSSVCTISDCVMRKLRGLVMVISLDCTKNELIREGNSKSPLSKSKTKENVGAASRKKKGKARSVKKLNLEPRTGVEESSLDKNHKVPENAPSQIDSTDSNVRTNHALGNDSCKDLSSSTAKMETNQEGVLGKGQNLSRKNRKGRQKNKKLCSKNNEHKRNPERSCTECPSLSGAKMLGEVSCSGSNSDLVSNDTISLSTSPGRSATTIEKIDAEGIQNDHVVCCPERSCEDTSTFRPDSHAVSHCVITPGYKHVSTNQENNIQVTTIKSHADFVDESDHGEDPVVIDGQDSGTSYFSGQTNPSEFSYEWPSLTPVFLPSINSHLLPATDRLHLDVGRSLHNNIRQPFVTTMHHPKPPAIEGGRNHLVSRPLPMSLDWPPMVRSATAPAPSITCNYDSEFISRWQSAFQQSFMTQNIQINSRTTEHERKPSGGHIDLPEATKGGPEQIDEFDSHWISEEELEVHAVSGVDYSQYFGGGLMYWDPADHPGTGFSRPPSLSSDDSSWAWREADMNRAVDDMVAFSSSYSTTGLTSPTAASFCSPFDTLGPAHQTLGYVVPGNEVSGKVLHPSPTTADGPMKEDVSGSLATLTGDAESKVADSLSYPILRPIIIPSHRNPHVPPPRREQPRLKRPPSPVVLCVPRAPRPPPPSPVSGSRKHRGFPTVRSGSSSPRHWSMRSFYHDGSNVEDACMHLDGPEVVWPSWRNKSLSPHPMIYPLSGALLQDRLIAMSQLARDQEHPDVSFPLQPPVAVSCPTRKSSLSSMQNLLHHEIDFFYKQVAAANMTRKPLINWAVKRVARSLQVLWPRSRTSIYGSNATRLSLPTSDVDLVVCLPPVRNLEPIKEAGILEGRNGIKETCLQHAARYLANQEWVKSDSLKTVENTAIPIIMLVVEVPCDLISSAAAIVQSPKEPRMSVTTEHGIEVQYDVIGLEDQMLPNCSHMNNHCKDNMKSIRLDISFKSPSHTGLQTTELVKDLTEQFPAVIPLALVLKQFLADRSLDQSYSGGLSSYCLVLLIIRFLQHEHHLGRPINQNFGSLFMDFLYFFGNVFDARQMRISVQGSGLYINRERGYSIDPIHIDDPLYPTNNVGRNCFRIHQCIKAFSEAYSVLEGELACLPDESNTCPRPPYQLLSKIIPSITRVPGI